MPKRPYYEAREGNVRVPVYTYTDGRTVVVWREFAKAPRRRESFPTKKAACERADELARSIANGQADVVTLTSADRDNYRLAVNALKPLGVPLHAAIAEFVAARGKLPAGITLLQIAEDYALRHNLGKACPPTAEIVRDLLAHMKADANARPSDKHLDSLESRLDAAALAFPNLLTATPDAFTRYLGALTFKGKPVAPKTRDHHRDALMALCNYAQRRGWLPKGDHAASELRKVYAPGEIVIYTVAEMRLMLAHARPEWIPLVVLGGFAGLRTTEIYRLRWEWFKWEDKVIDLPRRAARKSKRSRLVPIADNLAAWLLPYRKTTGPIYAHETLKAFESTMEPHLCRDLEKCIEGFEWKYNALRRSFVTYRTAQVKNPQQTRLEAGHSESMQSGHYLASALEREAKAWFALMPNPAAENVTPITAAS